MFENAEALRWMLELPEDHPFSIESSIEKLNVVDPKKDHAYNVNGLHRDVLTLRGCKILVPVLNAMSLMFQGAARPRPAPPCPASTRPRPARAACRVAPVAARHFDS